ncbi:NAD(P)-dependent dehydrogenase (short-subunit alcohol dehydrogenase family) [Rhodoglobus vestalii]|uniref:NAD(P)-dependent dehydrogenase (Short-subunit alcohol dehydrogenase family) n=1 Tax=Rhodoglobus vestalii TaxID=193384 RepID=A0A8H2K5Z6_9MICO|nr:SDR family oxidoreductase [Rhodoglobus vestalii]TQO19790.1 NAD(P)-dependent dehydrogenase (short-subunit alcohol dehydrogenase family) [Rhodoglobus vestalii]
MTNGLSLDDRTALITGVSGAIGSRIAATFVDRGARVAGTFRSREAEAADALVSAKTGRAALLHADINSPDSARELWQRAEAWHAIDTLVVNAAVMAPTSLTDDDNDAWDAGWERSFQVNVLGAATLMREAARSFSERGYGTIIAISSWAAEQGSRFPETNAYAASKAALRNFSQTLARSYVRQGVRVYVIAPGVVGAGMGTSGQHPTEIQATADGLARGRHVDPQEVAELSAFLATDRCPSLTGSTIDLNGASYIR